MGKQVYEKNEIYIAKTGEVQKPIVIISSIIVNDTEDYVIGVPVEAKETINLPTHLVIDENGCKGIVFCESIMKIPQNDLIDSSVSVLSESTGEEINQRVCMALEMGMDSQMIKDTLKVFQTEFDKAQKKEDKILESKVKERTKEIKDDYEKKLKASNEKLKKKTEELKKDMEDKELDYMQQVDKLTQEVAQYKEVITEYETESIEAKKKKTEDTQKHEREIQELKQKLAEASRSSTETDAVKKKCEKLESEKGNLEKRVREAEDKEKALIKENSDVREEIAGITASLKAANESLNATRARISELEKQKTGVGTGMDEETQKRLWALEIEKNMYMEKYFQLKKDYGFLD